MAKKAVKPIFAVKGEFTDSLDAFCQEAIFFLQSVEIALDLGQVNAATADKLRERATAFRASMLGDEEAE